MFKLIFSLAFVVISLLAALFGFLRAKRKKWQLTAVRIATTLISVIAAVLLAVFITSLLSDVALTLVNELAPAEVAELFAAESVSDSAVALVSMIIAPLLFYPLFAIIKPLLAIANKPLARLLVKLCAKIKKSAEKKADKAAEDTETTEALDTAEADEATEAPAEKPDRKALKREKKLARRSMLKNERITVTSSILGAVSGFLLFYIISIPSVCGLAVTGNVAFATAANINFEYADVVYDLADGAANNAGAVVMKYTGGNAAYRYMTTYDVAGHKATLEDELVFVANVGDAAILTVAPAEEYDGAQVNAAFIAAADSFADTTIIPSILPELLGDATDKWDAGEDFMGITKPSIGGDFEPVVDTLIDVLGNETYDTIKTDVGAILRVVGIIAKDTPVTTIKDDPLGIVKDEQTSSEIFELLYSCERLYELIPAFSECGINLICTTLEMHDDLSPLYDEMIVALETEIALAIVNYQPAVTLEAEPTVTLEAELAKVIKNTMAGFGVEITPESADVLAADVADGTTDIRDALAATSIDVLDVKENKSTVKLTSGELFAEYTQLVPTSKIEIHKDKPADIKNEAQRLAKTFSIVLELYGKLGGEEELSIRNIVVDLGKLLDSFDGTHTFGHDSTQNLLYCMLQSDKALDALNMSIIEITDVTYHICESAKTDSYTLLLQNLASTVDIIESISNGENAEESVEELIANLTPATATTIQQMATPSTMTNYGVPEASAEASANLVSDVFAGLSDAKENNTMTEEEYATEAKAVSDMISIAVNATNNTSASTTFGEGSATGITAEEYVDRITSSEVVSQTLIDTVYAEDGSIQVDPLNSQMNLAESEKADLIGAMNNQLSNTASDAQEQTQKQLIAAAALLNINVQIVDGAIVEIPTSTVA